MSHWLKIRIQRQHINRELGKRLFLSADCKGRKASEVSNSLSGYINPNFKKDFLTSEGLFLCHNKWLGDYLTLWIICTISEDNKELTAFCIEIAWSITLMNSLRLKHWKIFLAVFMHNSLIDCNMVDEVFGLFIIDGTLITYLMISFKITNIDYSE